MNNVSRTSAIASLLVLALFACACGPTYVQPVAYQNQQPQYEYNPGYNPDNAIADAILLNAVVNGINGYYGPGHIFYPSAMYGGVPGYYVGGVFHTSTQYRTTIVNNYSSGRTAFQSNPQAYAQAHPAAVKSTPNFGSQAGGVTRGPATQSAAPVAKSPAFGSQAGGVTRGPATQSAPAPTVRSTPNFGSQAGSMSRSSSSSSSSSSASRSAAPSTSRTGTSSRR